MDWFEEWYTTPLVVRKLTNTDPTSDRQTFDTPETLRGMVRDEVTITRDSTGAEVTSTVTVRLPVSAASKVNAGARVQLPTSQHPDTVVVSVSVLNEGDDLDGVTLRCL